MWPRLRLPTFKPAPVTPGGIFVVFFLQTGWVLNISSINFNLASPHLLKAADEHTRWILCFREHCEL